MHAILISNVLRYAALLLLGVSALPANGDSTGELGSDPLRAAIQRHEQKIGLNSRIFGGHDTTFARNPWQVALLYAGDDDALSAQFCGGIIIDKEWILTAAHCVDKGTKPTQVHVLSGVHDLRDGHRTRTPVDDIFVHPDWNKKAHDSDIALLNVKGRIVGESIPITSDSASPADGESIWISGWGLVDKKRIKPTPVLQGAHVDVINWDTCNSPASYAKALTPNMFCAGVQDRNGGGGRDSCQGDSGGPASTGRGANARLVGVVSWGIDCAQPYKYGVYTKVAKFSTWIGQQIREAKAKEAGK